MSKVQPMPAEASRPDLSIADAKARLAHVLTVTKEALETDAAHLADVLERMRFMVHTPADIDAMLAETRHVLARVGLTPSMLGYHHLAEAYAALSVARENMRHE